MSDIAISQRLTLDQLKQTMEYKKLTQKQQLFVATYCEGGLVDGNYDAVGATRTAYQCKSLEVARIMSYSLLANIRIIAVLNLHFNVTPTEDFMVMLDRAIRNKNFTMAQLGAMKLKCELMKIGNRLPGTSSVGILPDDILEASRAAKKTKKAPKDDPDTKPPKKSDYFS